jgi:hypothetical protein
MNTPPFVPTVPTVPQTPPFNGGIDPNFFDRFLTDDFTRNIFNGIDVFDNFTDGNVAPLSPVLPPGFTPGIAGPVQSPTNPGGLLQNPNIELPAVSLNPWDWVKPEISNWIIWIGILALMLIGTQATISGSKEAQDLVKQFIPNPTSVIKGIK